ncbi:MAG: sigma-70 family RNA polymerase sigma factor [Solirubrobacterales bacterium]
MIDPEQREEGRAAAEAGEGEEGRIGAEEGERAAARKRAAVETYARHERALRRTARRFSLCEDDAEDALQRGLEILLRKAPTEDPRELIRWTQTVVRHEALAVRRERERILAGPAALPGSEGEDWVTLIPATADGPPERAERSEAVARSREALRTLKPAELRALTLLAQGYSYREIGEITGFSATKINRCLAEGRERFRRFLTRSTQGERCTELRPLLSAYCDGETSAEEAAAVREHLRACAHCRATLRAYRAAPGAAAALAPALPAGRPLLERLHDATVGAAARLVGGGGAEPSLGQVAAAGGARGAGMAALAKVLAVCAGTVGAAACVATGVVPAPLVVGDEAAATRPRAERPPREPLLRARAEDQAAPATSAEPPPQRSEGTAESPPAEQAPEPEPEPQPQPPPVPESSAGAVEYAPPPPAPSPAPASSAAAAGSAAGEFGP